MGQTKEQRVIKQLSNPSSVQKRTAIATDMFLPNHSGDHSAGKVYTTPTDNYDIANKKYVDDNVGGTPSKIEDADTDTSVDTETTPDLDKVNVTCGGTLAATFSTNISRRLELFSNNNPAMEIGLHLANPSGNSGAGSGTVVKSNDEAVGAFLAEREGTNGKVTIATRPLGGVDPIGDEIIIYPNEVRLNSMIYGSYYIFDGLTLLPLPGPLTFYPISGVGCITGQLNQMTHANGQLTALVAGVYKIDYSVSYYIDSADYTGASVFQSTIMINGLAMPDAVAEESVVAANEHNSQGGTCILVLAANDIIEVAMNSQFSNDQITIRQLNVSAVRIGG